VTRRYLPDYPVLFLQQTAARGQSHKLAAGDAGLAFGDWKSACVRSLNLGDSVSSTALAEITATIYTYAGIPTKNTFLD